MALSIFRGTLELWTHFGGPLKRCLGGTGVPPGNSDNQASGSASNLRMGCCLSPAVLGIMEPPHNALVGSMTAPGSGDLPLGATDRTRIGHTLGKCLPYSCTNSLASCIFDCLHTFNYFQFTPGEPRKGEKSTKKGRSPSVLPKCRCPHPKVRPSCPDTWVFRSGE